MVTPKKRAIKDLTSASILYTELFQVIGDCKSKLSSTWKSIDENREAVEKANQP